MSRPNFGQSNCVEVWDKAVTCYGLSSLLPKRNAVICYTNSKNIAKDDAKEDPEDNAKGNTMTKIILQSMLKTMPRIC